MHDENGGYKKDVVVRDEKGRKKFERSLGRKMSDSHADLY